MLVKSVRMPKQHIYKWCLMLLGCVYFNISHAQCPIVNDAIQTWCESDLPTVNDLTVDANGVEVAWYLTATGGVQLPGDERLESGVLYYAGNSENTCALRPSVEVILEGPPPDDVNPGVIRCIFDTNTIAQLSATGTDIRWFDAPTDGNELDPSTPLVDERLTMCNKP